MDSNFMNSINEARRNADKQREANRQAIIRKQQEEKDYKGEVLRLLNEINGKLSK